MTPSPTPARRKRPWWHWALAGFVGLLILGALFGDDDSENTAAETRTVTVTQPAPTTTTAAQPAETIRDARAAADDDYARAISIAAALGAAEEDAIRRRIANRLARRALSAVRRGRRSNAGSLLRQAGGYPRTQQLTQARATYRAAKARAAERARAKRLAAEQSRQAAAARKAAQRAAAESDRNCDPNYEGACLDPASSDYDCQGGSGDGPDYTGPVRVVGSDPFELDRDGDGAACE